MSWLGKSESTGGKRKERVTLSWRRHSLGSRVNVSRPSDLFAFHDPFPIHSKRLLNNGLLTVLLVAGGCLWDIASQAREWRIEGIGDYEGFSPKISSPQVRYAYRFRVTIDTSSGLWLIHCTRQDVSLTKSQPVLARKYAHDGQRVIEGGIEDYTETGTDGINIFHISSLQTVAAKGRQEGMQVSHDAVGIVEPGPIPQVGHPFPTALWIAFASGRYFERNSSNRIELIFPSGLNSPDLLRRRIVDVTANWELFNNSEIVLPKEVVAIDSGVMRFWKNTTSSWVLPPETVKRPPPFDAGFTSWEYRVQAFTNILELRWPLSSRMEFFAPAPGGEFSFYTSQRISLYVERVEETEGSVALPKVPGVAMVDEERFCIDASPVYAFTYFQTNAWRSEADIHNSPEFKAQAARQSRIIPMVYRNEHRAKISARIVPIILLLVSVVPLLIILIAIARKWTRLTGSKNVINNK